MSVSVLLVYSTVSGNTEWVCRQVADRLQQQKIVVDIQRWENTTSQNIRDAGVVVLASPTYGHGELEPHFAAWLPQQDKSLFDKKPMAVVGLGDDKYDDDYTMESAKILTDWIKEAGGVPIVEPLRIHKSPVGQESATIWPWADGFAKKFLSLSFSA